MLKSVKLDLNEISDNLLHLKKTLDRLSKEERVDVGARIRGIFKTVEEIDKIIKGDVKEWLKHRDGVVPGENFKACLKLVQVTRLDQKGLKENDYAVYMQYAHVDEDERVSYEPR